VKVTCEKFQWPTKTYTSPIIWRELIDRGGRGTLVGNLNDFQEYAQSYYGVIVDCFMKNSSALFLSIANENQQQYQQDLALKKQYIERTIHPYHVGIIGADHPCTYALFPDLLSSNVFPNRDLCLRLSTSVPMNIPLVQALAMEIEDLACSQFHEIQVTIDNDEQSYEHMDLIVILDDYFHDEKQKYFDGLIKEKAQLKATYDDANLFDDERPPFVPKKMTYDLRKAYTYYRSLANRLRSTLKPTCRILLACSNSTMIATQAFIQTMKTWPIDQILGLARTLEYQAKARIGQKLHCDIRSNYK
jgi:hypothetical protein